MSPIDGLIDGPSRAPLLLQELHRRKAFHASGLGSGAKGFSENSKHSGTMQQLDEDCVLSFIRRSVI